MAQKGILVTGGSGFIGSHLVERLLASGESVTVLDDFSTGSIENLQGVVGHPHLQIVTGRVSAVSQLSEMVASAKYVFHLAATVGVELVVQSPVRTIETNLQETEAVLQAAAQFRTPLMLTSTSEVYGRSAKESFSETDDLVIGPPSIGRWSYACSKLMDEFLALAYHREKGVPVTVVRLFNTVGPRQTGRFGMVLPRFIESARRGDVLKVHGDGLQSRCFCHVADVLEAMLALANRPDAAGEVFNIGSQEQVTIRGLAQRVINRLTSSSKIDFIPYSTAFQSGFEDMQHRRPNLDKVRSLTGFSPRFNLDAIIDDLAR